MVEEVKWSTRFFFDLLDFFFSFMNVVSALTTSGSAGLKTGWFTFEKKNSVLSVHMCGQLFILPLGRTYEHLN